MCVLLHLLFDLGSEAGVSPTGQVDSEEEGGEEYDSDDAAILAEVLKMITRMFMFMCGVLKVNWNVTLRQS